MKELDLIRKYAESWNKLDISIAQSYFAEDITIFSQSTGGIVARGKTEVAEAVQNTMDSIKRGGVKDKIYAEIGFCSAEMVETVEICSSTQRSVLLPRIDINQPCILLAQTNKENFISVVVAEIKEGLIKQLFVCGLKIPAPENAVRTGEYPGLEPLTEKEELEPAEIEGNFTRRHLTWFDSPDHSYLQVAKSDLIELNVWKEMSPCSFGGEEFAYLEEDVDAGIFLEAARLSEWKMSFKHISIPGHPDRKSTGEEIKMLEDDPRCYWCQKAGEEYCDCPRLTCPVCGDEAACGGETSINDFSCKHLLAGWENEEFVTSVLSLESGISNEAVNQYEWTEKQLKTAFAETLPLYFCFKDGDGKAESAEFWDVLAELIPEIKQDSFCDTRPGAVVGWEAAMYFAENPEQVQRDVSLILEKLKNGYRQLANLLPEN